MGILSKLKSILGSSDAAEIAVKEVAEEVPEAVTEKEVYEEYTNDLPTGVEYFAEFVTEENFPGYTITANVHPQTIDPEAHPACFPVSFMFSKDSKAVLAVIVIGINQRRAMIAKGTYKVLDDNGIPYICFYKGMKNEKEYAIGRINENL
ncbi:MAG: hypothetical protein IKY78_00470 [Clostridia bacterium]|nr:hypothetical protein [Clostridia bacterium]